uniref:Sirtuin 5 n=1 Tax=Lepisosteus oculatus TaxID=7918 RepID=W5N683_LEPOC|nr:PREDICTED: NAD-dependent protein deacylase sirtuin-5, mitochondrial [Lepisosteus oculatus]
MKLFYVVLDITVLCFSVSSEILSGLKKPRYLILTCSIFFSFTNDRKDKCLIMPLFLGSLFKTRCINCGNVAENHSSPICPALEGKGAPDPDTTDAKIPVEDLPRCVEHGCNGLLRPHVVWFGETLDSDILTQVEKELEICDLCLVVGTSSIVYPAAMFAPQVAARGVPVAEFNTATTPATTQFTFHFQGPCGATLPPALARHETEAI